MQQQPEVTLTLPVPWIELLLNVLGGAPFNQVADLYISIRTQAQGQMYPQQLPSQIAKPNGGGADEARAA